MRPTRLILTAAAAAALAACSNNGDGRTANSHVCTPFPEQAANGANASAPAVAPADAGTAVDDCLHRWGYTLAASSDPAGEVAQATVAACASTLSRWNQQTAAGAEASGGPVTAPSLVTGQPATPISEHYSYAQGRAMFYVVQARAGKCAAPAAPPANR